MRVQLFEILGQVKLALENRYAWFLTEAYICQDFSEMSDVIPSGYKWLHTITPQRFPLSIATALIFSNCSTDPVYDAVTDTWSNVDPELGCQPLANSPVNIGQTTVKAFTEEVFGMKHNTTVPYFFVLLGYIVGFRILAGLALRFVNHQKK